MCVFELMCALLFLQGGDAPRDDFIPPGKRQRKKKR